MTKEYDPTYTSEYGSVLIDSLWVFVHLRNLLGDNVVYMLFSICLVDCYHPEVAFSIQRPLPVRTIGAGVMHIVFVPWHSWPSPR